MTRRALLGAGALGALAAAGCGDRTPAEPAGGDRAVLGTLAAIERELAAAWSAAGATPLPHDDVTRRLRAHARTLASAGAAYDRAAPASVTRSSARVAAASDGEAALAALLDAERAAATAYLTQLPGLRGPDARALATGLYAASAQRTSLVLTALGRDPLPDAFAGTLT